MTTIQSEPKVSEPLTKSTEFVSKINSVVGEVSKQLLSLKPGLAADTLYNEFWHWYCDVAIEQHKQGLVSTQELTVGIIIFLKLFHPFIPFVTEAIWQELRLSQLVSDKQLTTSQWPIDDILKG